jgi:hypothetical protein
MHTAWALYAFLGRHDLDGHGLVIDWLSVPASLYFLWVVRSLQTGTGTDWTEDHAPIVRPEGVAA